VAIRQSRYRAGGVYDSMIRDMVRDRGAAEQEALLCQEMMTTVLKLIDEDTHRGGLKIINSALKELRYGLKMFAPYSNIRKVSAFGSARTPKSWPEYKLAKQFGKRMAEEGFMVITGGASGIMEAANVGAGEKKSFGLNIRLPQEQEGNPILAKNKKFMTFKYFFTRKLMFVKESDALALFPGGFGTHDEGFEALTLIQTGKSDPLPVIMLEAKGRPYWKEYFTFVKKRLLGSGYISPEDLSFFKYTTDVEEAVQEIKRFYSNYHSSRFVKDLFLLRVHRVSPELIKELNHHFSGILRAKGRFQMMEALPEEGNEAEILNLPRIALPFNRMSYGKIRQAIDLINNY